MRRPREERSGPKTEVDTIAPQNHIASYVQSLVDKNITPSTEGLPSKYPDKCLSFRRV